MARASARTGPAATAAPAKKTLDAARAKRAGKQASKQAGKQAAEKKQGLSPRLRAWMRERVGRPTASYYWIIGTTLTLTLIGRLTVLSASTAETISEGQNPYELFIRESGFALIGLVLMFMLSFVTAQLWKRIAPLLILLAVALLALTLTPLGVAVQGNKNWLALGPLQFQPSETAKLALAVWMGAVLAAKGLLVRKLVHVLIPVGLGAGAILGLVMLGRDLGTAIIIGLMILAGLLFAAVKWWVLVGAVAVGALGVLLSSLTSDNRSGRIASWLGDCSVPGSCDQYLNGMYALASGGWFGVGVGQSRQKWNWIPEAHNDFIFAIIGEEFGLFGTLIILGLYALLAYAIFRVINTRSDTFSRIVAGMILTWIIGQAGVNIAVVVGLLPVIGVPLPLISYGGTALVMMLAAVGVVLSFSRTEPERALETS